MNTLHALSLGLVLSIVLAMCHDLSAQPASFQGLGTLPDTDYSQATDISADGGTIVGTCYRYNCPYSTCPEAFQWIAATGMMSLGFPPGADSSDALGVSANGSFIVGSGRGIEGDFAWRWSQDSGFVPLPTPNNSDISWAQEVSDDGQTIVGWSIHQLQLCPNSFGSNADATACRWTAGGLSLDTPNPLPGYNEAAAYVVSGDGQTAFGSSFSSNCNGQEGEPCLWIGAGGANAWSNYESNGFTFSGPAAVSHDGNVFVGAGITADGTRAFRWTASDGMVNLGVIPGFTTSAASAVSADGSVVVGACGNSSVTAAFIWDQANGLCDLRTTLIGQGADLTGWTLAGVVAISADGLTIVGGGINPEGDQEAWIAVLGNPSVCDADIAPPGGNGDVGADDLGQLLATWGACPGCAADFDEGGSVGVEDLAELLANWGNCP